MILARSPSEGYIEGAGISKSFVTMAFGAMLIGMKYGGGRTNLGG